MPIIRKGIYINCIVCGKEVYVLPSHIGGVTLCDKCHRKTDSWGGGVYIIPYNRKGKLLKYVIKIIPSSWQAYPTDVNYFHIKSGLIVIFCSDIQDESKHIIYCAKAMIESAKMLVEKIKSK